MLLPPCLAAGLCEHYSVPCLVRVGLMDRNFVDFGCVPEFDALAESIVARLRCDVALISVARENALIALGHSHAPECLNKRLALINETLCGLAYRRQKLVSLTDVRVATPAELNHVTPPPRVGAYIDRKSVV